MSAVVPYAEVLRLDGEIARLARGASGLRLAVGAALEALSSAAGHHELGFSSLDAYARERCERTGRWAADSRALARNLRSLPKIRAALTAGIIGWSTAELLSRHVTSESESEWLERALGVTVRELRVLLAGEGALKTSRAGDEPEDDDEPPTRALTVTATVEDAWLFEGARKVVEAVVGRTSQDGLLGALLAEGYATLLDLVPKGARSELLAIEELESVASAEFEDRARWRSERLAWQHDAEKRCEAHVACELDSHHHPPEVTPSWEHPSCASPEALDREIRRLCAELAERDLALGIVAESARKAEVWRRLGFASEAQYARERVGVSLSSLKAKRILAARACRIGELASALSTHRIGYEAAYIVSRIATPATAGDWIRLAEQRTIKHLRQEVEAAELLVRMGKGRDQRPLDQESLDALFELERAIASGDVLERGGDSTSQMSGGPRGATASSTRAVARAERRFARVTLRWSVRHETYRFWRALEWAFARVGSRVCRAPASFLRFLCENFCRTWLPALRRERLTDSGDEPEYFSVYRRDAFRCASPVCTRRDVTPHHLVFRAHGGGDEAENVASLCVWCHLRGVHEGRIRAEPPASRIRWRIGTKGTVRVDGRVREPAATHASATWG